MKMLFTAMLINALHATLEDAEIAFNGVGVDVAANIVALAVRGEVMFREIVTNLAELLGFICINDCFLGDVLTQDRQQSGRLQIFQQQKTWIVRWCGPPKSA